MEYLSKNYNVLPLDELIDAIKSGRKLRDYTCAITFDDGWQDNYKNAFPVLKKYHLPATIFITTGFIGSYEWFYHDKILYLISTILNNKDKITKELVNITNRWKSFIPLLHNDSLSDDDINSVINNFRGLPINDINTIISELQVTLRSKDFHQKDRF